MGTGGRALTATPPADRIRLGYFSADFHNHTTMHSMAPLFEIHNPDRFEVTAYS